MKIRLTENEVRARLSMEEVASLSGGSTIRMDVNFGGSGRLSWSLRPSADAPDIGVVLSASAAEISIPAAWLIGWEQNDRVGFETEIDLPGSSTRSIVIEKDFPCRHRAQEDV